MVRRQDYYPSGKIREVTEYLDGEKNGISYRILSEWQEKVRTNNEKWKGEWKVDQLLSQWPND